MRPIPARHILAVAQTCLLVVLALAGLEISRVLGWEFTPERWLPFKVAFFLNAPAVLLGGLLTLAWGYESDDRVFVLLSIPFVLFLWYAIGRELDKRRDLIPIKAPPVTWFRRRLGHIGLALSIILALLFFEAYVTSPWGGLGDPALAIGLWFGVGAYVLWRKLRHRRSPSNTPSELRITS